MKCVSLILSGLLSFFTTAGWAQPSPEQLSGTVVRGIPAAFAEPLDQTPQAKVRRFAVNCDSGGSLVETLGKKPGLPILVEFRGTCEETVTIERNDVTLRGMDSAATVVGQIGVKGAARVNIENFTIRDTVSEDRILDREGDGLRIVSSIRVIVRNLTVRNAASRGISLEGAAATFFDTTVLDTRGIGVVAIGSTVVIYNDFESSGSAINGMILFNAADVFIRPDARVDIDRNPVGLFIEEQGVMTVGVDATLSVKENEFSGIVVIGQGALLYASASIESLGNGGFGILVSDLSHFNAFSNSVINLHVADNMSAGIAVARSAYVALQQGVVVENNAGPGIIVDEATLWMGDVVSRDNGVDVVFGFGSKVTLFSTNELATLPVCDGSILLRGMGSCAPSATAEKHFALDLWQGIPPLLLKARESLR